MQFFKVLFALIVLGLLSAQSVTAQTPFGAQAGR